MIMSLAQALDAADKKGLFASNDNFVNYSTGLLPLDYANGFWLLMDDGHGGKIYEPITGIIGGTFISIIGTTGSGKSTLADQIGYSIIKPFEDGLLFHFDPEQTNLKQRMIRIMGADPYDERIRLKKDNTYIEDVLEIFNSICEIKEKSGDLYKYEVPRRSYNGKPFKAYVPTVFIIDSLPSFNSKEFNVEDAGTNMDGARGAKDVTRFYVNCLGRMQKYNITIITINHIRPKVVANQFSEPPAGLMMLKASEQLPRGYAAQYYSQNFFRVNALKSNMYSYDDVGFNGIKASIQIAKTKTAFVGATVDVCFNSDIGFAPIYTLFEFASSIKLVEGRNPWLYLRGMENFKFSRRDFRNKFLDDKIFRETFLDTIRPHLEALLGTKEISESDRVRYGDLMRQAEEQILKDEIEAEMELVAEAKKKRQMKVKEVEIERVN